MTLFAKAGHKIYDVDGKLFATVARDIDTERAGLFPGDFEFVDGRKPVIGEPLPRAIELFKRNGPHV